MNVKRLSPVQKVVFADKTTWWATDINLHADSPWSTLQKVTETGYWT